MPAASMAEMHRWYLLEWRLRSQQRARLASGVVRALGGGGDVAFAVAEPLSLVAASPVNQSWLVPQKKTEDVHEEGVSFFFASLAAANEGGKCRCV